MATSFQKRPRGKVIQIPGTKSSLYNNQLLVSTGIPTLDQQIGGGLAVGTVLLVEEDTYGNYGRLILKYFCAESVMTGHSLIIASADKNPEQLLQELPHPLIDDKVENPPKSSTQTSTEDGDMSIAWRYRHLPKFQSSPTGVKFGHYYDLTKTMPQELVNTIEMNMIDACKLAEKCENSAMYENLLKKINDQVEGGKFSTNAAPEKRNILRIAIHSLGSPLWGESGGLDNHESFDPSLARFLLGLRAILRRSFAVCMITVPSHLFCDKVFEHQIEKLCDNVVNVESFVGSAKEKNKAYSEYHGLFHIKKLQSLNTLVSYMPESFDLAFKLRRKKFTIEKLHLPPDLSETANRSQEDLVPNLCT